MDKQHIELYIGAWIDNNDGVYTQDAIAISEKMRQIALQFGVPQSKLPTMRDCMYFGEEGGYSEFHNELQRELEELLNEYCTTDTPPKQTCWAWNENAFGLWYTWVIYDEEIA